MTLAKVFHLQPGITREISQERLMSLNIDQIFDLTKKPMNIFKEWGLLTRDQLCVFQRVFTSHTQVQDPDKESNRLLYSYVRNCCTHSLKEGVKKDWEKHFSAAERGGVTYLYAVLCHVYGGNRAVTESLRNEVQVQFKSHGLGLFTGENAIDANNHFRDNVLNHLYARRALLPEMLNDILHGMILCSNPQLKAFFVKIQNDKQFEDIANGTGDYVMNSSIAVSQEEIYQTALTYFAHAESVYSGLAKNGEWTSASGKSLMMKAAAVGGEGRLIGIVCFNCGGPHRLSDCPEPKDRARIADAQAKYRIEQAAKRRGGGDPRSTPKSGIPERDVTGETSDGKKDWRARKSRVQFRCCHKDCGGSQGKWGNHTTLFHEAAVRRGDDFSMLIAKPNSLHTAGQREPNPEKRERGPVGQRESRMMSYHAVKNMEHGLRSQ